MRNKEKHRLVVVGIDAMDPYVFENIQKDMPHLSAIASSGGYKHNETVFPPDSIPAWVTIFTGEYPANHGWLDNIDYEDIRKGAEVNKLCDLQGKTFWDHLSQAGKRVCIINPLMAYPVWPVNGIMVNGPVFITGEKQIYPPELTHQYTLPELGGMTDFPAEKALINFLETTLQSTRNLADFGLELMNLEAWDLFFISFFSLDRIQHFLWRFWDPTDPLHPGPSDLADSIPKAYKTFDDIVGNILKHLDHNTGLLVLSDHGHGQRPTKLFNLNELLRQEGFLKTGHKKDSVISWKKGIEITKNTSIKLVTKVLGEKWLYRIGRLMPKRMRQALKKSSYLIDKEHSLAWTSDLGGGAPAGGIEINPKTARLESEYQITIKRLLECLEDINHRTSEQVINWVRVKNEKSHYPDIIFELMPQYSVGRSLYCPLLENNPRHRIISGGHKKEGILFSYNCGELATNINSLNDISKSILAYMLPHAP